MMEVVATIGKYTVKRDNKTGIALVSDGSGIRKGVHASIDKTGSVRGMKQNGGWRREDRVVRAAGFQFNIDTFVCDRTNEAERIAADFCRCAYCQERRLLKNGGHF